MSDTATEQECTTGSLPKLLSLKALIQAHRIATIEECADTLVAYCKAMNESGAIPSFVDAHTAILALKGPTNDQA